MGRNHAEEGLINKKDLCDQAGLIHKTLRSFSKLKGVDDMLRGFYTAASGMISQQRRQEALSNNVANMNTPGYKADQATLRAFPELLMQRIRSRQLPVENGEHIRTQQPIGSMNTGVYVQELVPNFLQGDLKETGVTTDLALVHGALPDASGSLFFTVQNEEGDVRYTRNGNFTIDGNGALVTTEGYHVLDQDGEPINTFNMEFTVTQEGNIQLDGQTIPLGVAYTPDAQQFAKEGNGLFSGEADAPPEGVMYTVQQGFLERSNVDASRTMTEMMQAYRLFEMNQRVLKAYDESMGKAVSEIARLG